MTYWSHVKSTRGTVGKTFLKIRAYNYVNVLSSDNLYLAMVIREKVREK